MRYIIPVALLFTFAAALPSLPADFLQSSETVGLAQVLDGEGRDSLIEQQKEAARESFTSQGSEGVTVQQNDSLTGGQQEYTAHDTDYVAGQIIPEDVDVASLDKNRNGIVDTPPPADGSVSTGSGTGSGTTDSTLTDSSKDSGADSSVSTDSGQDETVSTDSGAVSTPPKDQTQSSDTSDSSSADTGSVVQPEEEPETQTSVTTSPPPEQRILYIPRSTPVTTITDDNNREITVFPSKVIESATPGPTFRNNVPTIISSVRISEAVVDLREVKRVRASEILNQVGQVSALAFVDDIRVQGSQAIALEQAYREVDAGLLQQEEETVSFVQAIGSAVRGFFGNLFGNLFGGESGTSSVSTTSSGQDDANPYLGWFCGPPGAFDGLELGKSAEDIAEEIGTQATESGLLGRDWWCGPPDAFNFPQSVGSVVEVTERGRLIGVEDTDGDGVISTSDLGDPPAGFPSPFGDGEGDDEIGSCGPVSELFTFYFFESQSTHLGSQSISDVADELGEKCRQEAIKEYEKDVQNPCPGDCQATATGGATCGSNPPPMEVVCSKGVASVPDGTQNSIQNAAGLGNLHNTAASTRVFVAWASASVNKQVTCGGDCAGGGSGGGGAGGGGGGEPTPPVDGEGDGDDDDGDEGGCPGGVCDPGEGDPLLPPGFDDPFEPLDPGESEPETPTEPGSDLGGGPVRPWDPPSDNPEPVTCTYTRQIIIYTPQGDCPACDKVKASYRADGISFESVPLAAATMKALREREGCQRNPVVRVFDRGSPKPECPDKNNSYFCPNPNQ
ncbi:MAG: hypothetical protein Q8P45_01800 [Candidatus Harrisonbacteria bacterium]|nr:hypothetical protein [Candidatus Harrisonbacteria bacterium]